MNTIFINSEKSKTSNPHRVVLILTEKIDSRRKDKYIALLNLSIYYSWNNMQKHKRMINLKYQLQNGMKNLNFQ